MSSDDDSDSANESKTYDKIRELINWRNEKFRRKGNRKLYDDDLFAARRSLNVQKILSKQATLIENPVCDSSENEVAIQDCNKVPNSRMASQSLIQSMAHKKSIICSTPMTRPSMRKFKSSLSPIKNISVGPEIVDSVLCNITQKNNILDDIIPLQDAVQNKMQPIILLVDVRNNSLQRGISDSQMHNTNSKLKSAAIHRKSKPEKLSLTNMVKADSKYHSQLAKFAATSDKTIHKKTISKSSTTDRKSLCTYQNLDTNSNRECSSLRSKESLSNSKLLIEDEPIVIGQRDRKSVDSNNAKTLDLGSELKSSSTNVTRRNSSSKTAKMSKSDSLNTKATLLEQECSILHRIDNRSLLIPETQDESEKIELSSVLHSEKITKSLQPICDETQVAGISTSSNLNIQSLPNKQVESRLQNQSNKQTRKKKINESYMNFLCLENTRNGKSFTSGSKRKLYSSDQESTNLVETSNNESDIKSRRNQSFQKSLLTTTQNPAVIDSDGFKIPNIHFNTKLSSTKNISEPLDLVTSEIEVIAENIRILNKSRANKTLNITVTKESLPSNPNEKCKGKKKKKNRKQTSSKNVPRHVEQNFAGMRRSNRVKHEPMTFWKVHKEPITDNRAKFYNKMVLDKSDSTDPKRPKKAQEPPLVETLKRLNKVQGSPLVEKPKRPTRSKKVQEPPLVENPINDQQEMQPNNAEQINVPPMVQIPTIQGTRNNDSQSPVTVVQVAKKKHHTSDSALQETMESEVQTNAFENFLKKFNFNTTNEVEIQNSKIPDRSGVANDFLRIDSFVFQSFSDMPGLEFAFVPNSNEMLGFLKLQPGGKKPNSRTSRKYFLTLMLFTDSSVMIKVNQKSMEMTLGDLDTIQLPPDSNYELVNNSTKTAILLSFRTSARR